MSGGGISTSATRIEAVKLQSSSYGVTLALMYGVTRVAGNMVWYGNFEAVPRTTTQGGKGGGGISQTDFSYRADVVMALGHGFITSVPRIWRGKKLYAGGIAPLQVHTEIITHTPEETGIGFAVPQASTFLGVVSVTYSGNGGGGGDNPGEWALSNGDDYTFNGGVFVLLNEILAGRPLTLAYQYTTGAVLQSALDALGLVLKPGAYFQTPWTGLSGTGEQELGYSGIALLCGKGYDLGDSAQVENHTVEVVAQMAYHLGPDQPDVDLSLVVRDVLLNGRYGAAFPSSALPDWQAWSNWCVASNLLVSPSITQQRTAAELVRYAAELTNVGPVWSSGKLRMVPFGDTATTGNGRTFTPDDTVAFELTDEEFTRPLVCEIKSPADRKNHTRVEFLDRGNQYNVAVAEAKDQADIDANGLRTADTMEAHWVCDADTARQVAQIKLQRSLYVVNTYTGELPWHFAFLEPMDLCVVTDPGLGLDATPLRVMAIDENEVGDLTVTFEDYPAGVAGAVRYPAAVGDGFAPYYNAPPGDAAAPVIFEAPADKSVTGLEVYIAVKGEGPNWGGCGVWISLDDSNYRRVATVRGASRYGNLTGPISAGSLPVVTSGQLVSGSAADAAALETLCWVGGATQEYLAYQIATLTGPGTYALSGLVRGAYLTPQSSAHSANDPFVRVDDSIAKSGPLDLAMIGKTIRVKLTSFNLFLAAEQSLADVQSYPYTIIGAMAQLRPAVSLSSLGLNTFRVVAAGFSATAAGTVPAVPGLYVNGVHAYVSSRSYRVATIRRSDGLLTFEGAFDVFGDPAAPAAMAAVLNALGPTHIVIVWTHDEPGFSRKNAGLDLAMYRCGASRAVFGSPQFKSRAAYVMVGIAGCGEGNGAEAYQGSIDSDPYAWCDLSFGVVGGVLTGVSGTYTPRSLQDYGYTGALNATAGAALNSDPGCTSAALWSTVGAGFEIAAVTDGAAGPSVWRKGSAGGLTHTLSNRVPVDRAKTYRAKWWIRKLPGTDGLAFPAIALFDSAGAVIAGDGALWAYPMGGSVSPAEAWTEYVGTVGAGTTRPIPANAASIAIGAFLGYDTTIGHHEMQGVLLEDVTDLVTGLAAAVSASAVDASAKADAAQAAAVIAAQAKADLAKAEAKAYADGVVDAEEARALADATNKAAAAQAAAVEAAAADATAKANAAALTAQWSGISGVNVTTGQIAAGAVTSVFVDSDAAVSVDGVTGVPYGPTTSVNSLVFTPDASGDALVTVSGGGFHIAGQLAPGSTDKAYATCRCAFHINGARSGVARHLDVYTAVGERREFAISASRRFAVLAGVQYSVAFSAQKFDSMATLEVSTEMRVEVIKR